MFFAVFFFILNEKDDLTCMDVINLVSTKCVGGGRITHDPENKYIKIYGYSMSI